MVTPVWAVTVFGVPVVLVTGDDLTCADAEDYAPGAQRVAVKQCVDRFTAVCLPPARTAELITAGAQTGLRDLRPGEPVRGPFSYEVEFDGAQAVLACTGVPGVTASGERSVTFTLPTMAEAIRCFRVLTVLASASLEPAAR